MAVKTISVPNDIKEFLNKLPNASKYIVGLIKRDIEEQEAKEDIEGKIRQVVSEMMEQGQITVSNEAIQQVNDSEFRGEIEDLLDM